MLESEILEILCKTLEVPNGSISLEDDLRSKSWDSLADIIFIGAVDDAYGKTLNPEKLLMCSSAQDFITLVSESS
jgi:acyl carrier protein